MQIFNFAEFYGARIIIFSVDCVKSDYGPIELNPVMQTRSMMFIRFFMLLEAVQVKTQNQRYHVISLELILRLTLISICILDMRSLFENEIRNCTKRLYFFFKEWVGLERMY